jgi:hypothetical protein
MSAKFYALPQFTLLIFIICVQGDEGIMKRILRKGLKKSKKLLQNAKKCVILFSGSLV